MNRRSAILLLAGLGMLLLLLTAVTLADAWGWVACGVGGLGLGLLALLLLSPGARSYISIFRHVNRRDAPWRAAGPLPPRRSRPVRAAVHPPLAPLAQLKALTPTQFEEFARLLLLAVGYQDVQRVGGSGDQGVDLRMRDAAGNLCVAQCKRYHGTVSPAVVRELYGVLARTGAREAYLITTGRVSHDAQAWIGDKPLHVWPADRLIRYAEQHLGDRLPATIQAARRAA